MFKLAKFKFFVDLLLKHVLLQFDLNCFCSFFMFFITFSQTFLFFAAKTNAEIAWREWEAFWPTYREVGIRKHATGCQSILYPFFAVMCFHLAGFQLFFTLPACWKDQRFISCFAVSDACNVRQATFLFFIKGNNQKNQYPKIRSLGFMRSNDPYQSLLMLSSFYQIEFMKNSCLTYIFIVHLTGWI
jgi:hypothetical protein